MRHTKLKNRFKDRLKSRLKSRFPGNFRDKARMKAGMIARLMVRGRQVKTLARQNLPLLVVASLLVFCVMAAPTFGVTVETLKAPIKDLKDTIFGGWMWIPKIGAAVGGCVMAVYQQSIVPLATGAAIGLGIHFYDSYIDASGALI